MITLYNEKEHLALKKPQPQDCIVIKEFHGNFLKFISSYCWISAPKNLIISIHAETGWDILEGYILEADGTEGEIKKKISELECCKSFK